MLTSARTLAQQFGISFTEDFDVLEDQLVRGQKNNNEFFDNISEYPVFFSCELLSETLICLPPTSDQREREEGTLRLRSSLVEPVMNCFQKS
ncbi:hypothetical protein RQM65_11390 [Pricia sp. S334]|uniref:Uncharacterized protein n=1 Tax=Pricia mediterranea TaxID=3076079 RepID=A0ABU3L6A1_9FLAO|nr:hypothetical protein [Pricia sp. S334]MDT7829271.1 hypothetical protein [Pricia sp. S334]